MLDNQGRYMRHLCHSHHKSAYYPTIIDQVSSTKKTFIFTRINTKDYKELNETEKKGKKEVRRKWQENNKPHASRKVEQNTMRKREW